MPEYQTTITPHNQQPYIQCIYPTPTQLDRAIQDAVDGQKAWAKVPLEERIEIGRRFLNEFQVKGKEEVGGELAWSMGRPISQGAGEVKGVVERAEYMLSVAGEALGDTQLSEEVKPGYRRYIKRVPLGVVFVIAPWNYPYLTSINSILPALIASNAVLLKPSPQTPTSAERLVDAFIRAGVPQGVIQTVHLSQEQTMEVVRDARVGFVSFTGSVKGGREVGKGAVGKGAVSGAQGGWREWVQGKESKGRGEFKGVVLELGGKDPAYVREDAEIAFTVGELVDGAFFNSGQSCCSIERIYVHEKIYDEFVEKFVELTKTYKLGDPTNPSTTLGPVVSLASAERITKQVEDAVRAGARKLIPEELFGIAKAGTTYVAPQVLVDVDHSMEVMMEETFGPVVGIMKVTSDAQALALMNDSPYGLTASVWTNASNTDSVKVFEDVFVEGLETGTVFLNKCDYLDPGLVWGGVGGSGRGGSLGGRVGYEAVTRAKSVLMRVVT